MVKSIVNLFFPKVCYACLNLLNDNEDTICLDCRHDLPITNFHFDNNDAVKKVLYGRAELEHGTALFRFEKKGNVQRLIHNLKYKDHEHIGFVLGNWLGGELKTLDAYKNIDAVIPVPLHKNKLKKRGYNQVAKFGQQISEALGADYLDDVLIKITNTKSQTTKARFTRWMNNDELFALKNMELIDKKHILVVDDLITTGATLEACIGVLNQAKNVKISIATMAIA
ncbi:MAG: phosphoribosyltransferase family protein [Algibacter sp.]|uniref:ComF family protein n=1 Tax=Algibacter sp. TaxID=1872428 RepID=UPI0026349C11|nr:phosphoribosyltransferase family protein [Algibacter sp.]MDG1731196.1 phosphoribosyltransferase family protein [Algibacter sp.]MDG2178021.1 phosphoribosyltransferase family protein [Algibacter sp.]